ncbi:MAG: hypothetical protein GEV11_26570 [Streptosporangiales bacterium]|nr:hypothetical protein [Streptosporangiales bacterium]
MSRRRRGPLPAPFLAILPLAALLLLACGSGDDSGVATAGGATATPSASSTTDKQQAMLAYARCMRENGVNVPDPQPGQDGATRLKFDRHAVPQETLRKAQEACREHLGGMDVKKHLDDPQAQAQLLAYARCMRENGVNMPDPDFSGSGGAGGADREKFLDDPEWESAQQACRKHLENLMKQRSGS